MEVLGGGVALSVKFVIFKSKNTVNKHKYIKLIVAHFIPYPNWKDNSPMFNITLRLQPPNTTNFLLNINVRIESY